MLVQRAAIKGLIEIIDKSANKIFDIQTQYKLIKLKQAILPEMEILDMQLESLTQFFEKDENGEYIYTEDGGIKIKKDNIEQCSQYIKEINELQISLPDVYFSLEELAPLGLTLSELELFDFCIK